MTRKFTTAVLLAGALMLLLAGCENNVAVSQMEACQKTCAPRPVKQVTATMCECFVGEASK